MLANGHAGLALRQFVSQADTRTACRGEIAFAGEIRPFFVIDALHQLAADGHALAVLSNKPDDLTVELVRRYFPDVPFALVRGGREGVPLKPEPDAPLDMLRHMDFLPERSFYVGDSNVDIFTARNAGMISIGVAWGFRGADELRAAQADHVIDTPVALTRMAKEA